MRDERKEKGERRKVKGGSGDRGMGGFGDRVIWGSGEGLKVKGKWGS